MAMVDLRQLINKIQEQKQANVNLTLEFECTVETDDFKPLVKVINYFMNFCEPIAEGLTVEVSLNAAVDYYNLSFIAPTSKTEVPEVNEQVVEILKDYDAEFSVLFKPGKFYQATIQFNLGE